MNYNKENQPVYKNRLITEFIKADIRVGQALVGVANDNKFSNVHLQRRALNEAKIAYLAARELATEAMYLSAEDVKWIIQNLYKLKRDLQRLGQSA